MVGFNEKSPVWRIGKILKDWKKAQKRKQIIRSAQPVKQIYPPVEVP